MKTGMKKGRGDRSPRPRDYLIRSPKSEVRSPKSEVRGPRSDARRPTSEVRRPTPDVRRPFLSDFGLRTSDFGLRSLEREAQPEADLALRIGAVDAGDLAVGARGDAALRVAIHRVVQDV